MVHRTIAVMAREQRDQPGSHGLNGKTIANHAFGSLDVLTMPSSPVESDHVEGRLVCSDCIEEKFLHRDVKRSGIAGKCHYCEQHGKCWSISQLSDRIDKAFQQHLERTPENPDGVEAAMMNDRECSYEWHRDGEESIYAIANAASVSEEIAEDVREVLHERYYDRSSSEMGDEQEFDSDAHYDEKKSTGDEYSQSWSLFERCLREESRYFAPVAKTTLDQIFMGVADHKTVSGRQVVVHAGPGTKLDHLFRARVFYSDNAVIEAIERPDRHLGPPPAKLARPGRMNASGISVFYGARSLKVALAEVRPPVGSKVVCGRFLVTRPLKLLDLDSLRNVVVRGSLFDPTFADRSERAAFLGTLCDRLSRAVMPDDETSGYLVTQVVADYLANAVKLDGILFPSVQSGAKAANVVLFHKASRVQALDLPEESGASWHRDP
jgi:hypothetical protein